MRYFSLIISLFIASFCAWSDELDKVQALLDSGRVKQAVAMADSITAARPKDADAHYMLGRCLLAAHRTPAAEQAFTTARGLGYNEAILALAEIEANRYQIAKAESLVDEYKKLIAKNKRKKQPDYSERTVALIAKIDAMLDRVEKIQVIDSLIVDKADFFAAYRLSPESGSLNTPELLPGGFPYAKPTCVYLTEDGREMMWGAKDDATGLVALRTTDYLADGTWESPLVVGDHLGQGGNANYPFLMPDGITLYFASDCEESIGGYDIFISRNNGTEFLQPQNLGMPYNSPADDYMLAIDEMNGVGWWATDRNHINGKLTIYIFIPSDLRINVDREDPSLASRAMVSSIKSTWEPDTDYSPLLKRVMAIIPPKSAPKQLFEFQLPDGRIARNYRDFNSAQAREAMGRYVEIEREIVDIKAQLAALREKYARGDDSTSQEILYLERDLLQAQGDLSRTRNDIIRAEIR